MIRRLRPAALALTMCLAGAGSLRAQCPDGMPPPCARPAAPPPAARVAADENVVAIFPFRVSGSSTEAGWLREGAADLMNLALDEQAGWRAVSQRSVLAAARTLTDATPESDFARAARGLGAGTMILGTAIVVGPQLRARVVLHDVIRGRIISTAERRGTLAEPAQLIDSLSVDLARARLVQGAPGTRRSLDEYTASPRALRAYLAAERLGRRGDWVAAAESLVVAIEHDSTFGLAYYRLGIAISFGGDPAGRIPPDLPGRARQLVDRLPRRHRDLVEATSARVDGDRRRALTLADALGRAYPDDAEAAYEQGEAYYHLGIPAGEPPERALAAYERAGRLDSLFLDPWGHMAELRMMVGDGAGALAAAAHGRRVGPSSPVHKATEMAMRAIVRGESPARLVAEADAERWRERTGYAVPERACIESLRGLTSQPARALALCEAFLTAAAQAGRPTAERFSALALHAEVAVVGGRIAAAESLAAAARALDPAGAEASLTEATVALIGGRSRARARASLRSNTSLRGLALRGLLELEDGDTTALRHTLASLTAPAPDLPFRQAVAAALRDLAALQRHDSMTAAERMREADVLSVLTNRSASAAIGTPLVTLTQWNLQLARMEAARGAPEAALRRLSEATFVNGLVFYRGDYEEVRARVLEQTGDRDGARTAWRNVIGLWEHADAPWQPRVAAARAQLARLEQRP